MPWHRGYLYGPQENTEMEAPIRQALVNVLDSLPPGAPVVVINNLSLTINYAQGGGATVNVRNK